MNLTTQEKNVIKSILRAIGQDDELNAQFAHASGMSDEEFDIITESVFEKLGNGQVTVQTASETYVAKEPRE